ncbi:MAG: urease accessory protein UreF [Actinomycetota bacterium]|nr:urease accessory protein UreF [Actinomycetota bacterium]
MAAVALLLADGRFPAGGHAHSGGVEVAVARGRVGDLASLVAFLRGRLATSGLVDAALAAATCHRGRAAVAPWGELTAEAEARQPSPALRIAWRVQGRALLRAARRAWPGPVLDGLAAAAPDGVPHPVALGAVAAAAGLAPAASAALAAHQAVAGPASAAVRLLGIDPLDVAAAVAGLAGEVDAVAAEATTAATGHLADLPCRAAPLLELGAEDHAAWEVRLFAS